MKVVLQRSEYGSVTINSKINGKCDKGFVILVGFTHEDNEEIIDKMVSKIVNLRVFEDETGKLNKSILDINGNVLSISQFTLYADCKEGRRPSFTKAMNFDEATRLYDVFNDKLRNYVNVQTGVFGEDMKVNILNDGPITIILDSNELFN